MNEIGELYVSGWNLASGYVKGRDPDKFVDNTVTFDPGTKEILFKTRLFFFFSSFFHFIYLKTLNSVQFSTYL